MWRHLTNGHVIEENRHQNKAYINTEQNVSTQFELVKSHF